MCVQTLYKSLRQLVSLKYKLLYIVLEVYCISIYMYHYSDNGYSTLA